MNKIIIIGNLTSDPNLRTVNVNGVDTPNCRFSVAVNERVGGQERTTFFNVTTWRGQAEVCAKYLAKGRKVYVEGPLRASVYQANSGETRVSLDVAANTVEFLSSAQQSNEHPTTAAAQPHPQQPATVPNYGAPVPPMQPTGVIGDELPF